MRAHPPPVVPAVRAGSLLKLGAGRLSFFQSLEPADSCSVRPGAAALTAGQNLSHILEDSAKTSCVITATEDHKPKQPEIKTALTKKS